MNPEPMRADALTDEDGAEPDGSVVADLDHDALRTAERVAERVANDYHVR
jgi:hypothetical protein